jgi:predicted transcriptional regulator
MPRTAREVPPPLELLCLSALWTLEEGDVKAVRETVAQSRPLAYTTIMTVLDRLVRKGKLARRKQGRAFVYSPVTSRDSMRRVAIQELLEGFFDGSQDALLHFLKDGTAQAAAAVAGRAPQVPAPQVPAPPEEDTRIDTVLL